MNYSTICPKQETGMQKASTPEGLDLREITSWGSFFLMPGLKFNDIAVQLLA